MRERVNLDRVQQFMNALSSGIKTPARVYLVGGVSAVLFEWRTSTIDIDLKIEPDADEILRRLPEIKEALHLNIELASPDQFIPELPGWRERSVFIKRVGQLDFFHYDFYSQALAKIERDHVIDRQDVSEMIDHGLVSRDGLMRSFEQIENDLYRYPAVNQPNLRQRVEKISKAT